MKVLVLLAGYATRLYPLTEYKPKALLPIKGITILDHILEKAEKINDANEIIIISNNKFANHFYEWKNTYKGKKSDCVVGSIATKEELNERRYAVASLENNGKVINFEEKPEHPKSNIIVHATYIYQKETLPLFKKYLDEGNSKDSPGNFPAWLYTK